MKSFLQFINESAAQQAARLGLVGDGHGGWYDKATGEVLVNLQDCFPYDINQTHQLEYKMYFLSCNNPRYLFYLFVCIYLRNSSSLLAS